MEPGLVLSKRSAKSRILGKNIKKIMIKLKSVQYFFPFLSVREGCVESALRQQKPQIARIYVGSFYRLQKCGGHRLECANFVANMYCQFGFVDYKSLFRLVLSQENIWIFCYQGKV